MKSIIKFGVFNSLIVAALALPHLANAQPFLLDSGTPTSSTFPILNNTDWFAAEFSATAGETVTELSAYITSVSGNGNGFAFDIYTDGGGTFLSTRNALLSSEGYVETTATGTFTTAGWTSANVNWVVPTTGNYWLAIEGNTAGTRNLPNYDVQEETSATTGTAPALAFAYDSGVQFNTSTGVPVGLEVTMAVVPEPTSGSLIAVAGVLGLSFGAMTRRIETTK